MPPNAHYPRPTVAQALADTPRIRVVILNYNGGDLVVRAVGSACGLDWPPERLEVVVVDNASSDGSDLAIETAHPGVRVLRSGANRGFPGNNLAMVDRRGLDYVALVNPDAFVDPGWLRALVDAIEADEHIGAACPKILLADRFVDVTIRTDGFEVPGDPRELGVRLSGARRSGDDVRTRLALRRGAHGWEPGSANEPTFTWTAGEAIVGVPVEEPLRAGATLELRLASLGRRTVEVSTAAGAVTVEIGDEPVWVEVPLGGEVYDVVNNAGSVLYDGGWSGDRGFLERDEGQYDEPAEVFAWCGAGVLLRAAYLDDVGLFEDRFFLYYEDTDLSWRGRARGWRYVYTPAATMRHVHSASAVEGSPLFTHYVERNRLLMLTRNAPASWVRRAAWGYVLATASYARRDIVRAALARRRPRPELVVRRAKSFAAWARILPSALRDRRSLRRRQVVPDAAVTGWAVPR